MSTASVGESAMIAKTAERVSANTCDEINTRIRQQTEANIRHYTSMGDAAIDRRLEELNEEWDIERCLETVAPILTLTGIGLGAAVDKRWLAFSAIIQGFFLQHAIQGWCPPVPVLRRLGVRTAQEIDAERMALKVYRGSFQGLEPGDSTLAQRAYGVAIR